jgi:hypothetical protein
MNRPVGSESDDLACSHPDPTPHRHGFTRNRQRNQNHFGRHGKERDPRQLLLAGRYPQAVQRDPC